MLEGGFPEIRKNCEIKTDFIQNFYLPTFPSGIPYSILESVLHSFWGSLPEAKLSFPFFSTDQTIPHHFSMLKVSRNSLGCLFYKYPLKDQAMEQFGTRHVKIHVAGTHCSITVEMNDQIINIS